MLFFQQLLILDGIQVDQTFDDLVSDTVLITAVLTKLACLGKLLEATEEIVECFP